MEKTHQTIKEVAEKILSLMAIDGRVEITADQAKTIVVNIDSPEGGLLIGQGGVNLFALQHIIRLVAGKTLKAKEGLTDTSGTEELLPPFILDINNYQQHRTELLKELALSKANQAIAEQREVAFSPMSSFDRRIIHLILKNIPQVVSQSEGEGENRHIVIKPIA